MVGRLVLKPPQSPADISHSHGRDAPTARPHEPRTTNHEPRIPNYSATTFTNSDGAPFVSTWNSSAPSAVAVTTSPTGWNGSDSDGVA